MDKNLLKTGKSPLFSQTASPSIQVEEFSLKEIAVIGMSGRFGAAADLAEFWRGLCAGRDFIGPFPPARITDSEWLSTSPGGPPSSKGPSSYSEGAYLPVIDRFDPLLFNLSPKEAALTDPQQRIFLETVWAALEDAGYGGRRIIGTRTGVFVGHSSDFGYEYKHLINLIAPAQVELSIPGNIHSIIASRISYLLDLKGPSLLVNTACSSSLIAIHLACRSLRSGECDLAIAGGVKAHLAAPKAIQSGEGVGILSAGGRARTFDDSSSGTGIGEGAGAVLLKPLAHALRDGDRVYAVIKGSAINQDGSTAGITAPNSAAQEEVILRAWKDAKVPPETITYIEAHGTGTKLGDPIEISGIHKAFRHYTTKNQFCAVASVKTNVGHLDHAAGIVAFIKAVLALRHRQLPPSLHFQRPNRKINFTESPVYVNDRLTPWPSGGAPLRCGVSSFGLSGANCHLVLEEAPPVAAPPVAASSIHILPLSAQTAAALHKLVQDYCRWLAVESGTEASLASICYTASTGRGHYQHRLALIVSDLTDLHRKLKALAEGELASDPGQGIFYRAHKLVATAKAKLAEGEITTGQRSLLDQEAGRLFAEMGAAFDNDLRVRYYRIAEIYTQGADIDWEALYKSPKPTKTGLPVYPFQRRRCWVEPELSPADYWQAAVPSRISHPLFDRCLADSYNTLIYATRFSVQRHWVLSEHQVAGSYVAPGTTYMEMAAALGRLYYPGKTLEFHEVYFMTPLVVKPGEIKEIHTLLRLENNFCSFAITSRAGDGTGWAVHAEGKFQTSELPPAPVTGFHTAVKTFHESSLRAPSLETPSAHPPAIATGPRWESLRRLDRDQDQALAYFELPAQFSKDLEAYQLHPALLDCAVNIGIRSLDTTDLYLPFSYQNLRLYRPLPGKLYSYLRKNANTGAPDLVAFDITLWDENGAVIAELKNYLIKKVPPGNLRAIQAQESPALYYQMEWVPQTLPAETPSQSSGLKPGLSLIFLDESGLGAEIAQKLRNEGHRAIEVTLAPSSWAGFGQEGPDRFTAGVSEADFLRLLTEIKGQNLARIIYLSTCAPNSDGDDLKKFQEAQRRGLYGLFFLAKALLAAKVTGETALVLIVNQAYQVTNTESNIQPLHAALLGLVKVTGQEYEKIKCRGIDIDSSVTAGQLLAEIASGGEEWVAYRDGQRYREELTSLDLQAAPAHPVRIRDQGVYLITGGTGGLGLEVGKYLAGRNRANLCLVSRTGLPPRKDWDRILAGDDAGPGKLRRQIQGIRDIEAKGARVRLAELDIADATSVEALLKQLRAEYGKINGIIHCAGAAGDGFLFRKDLSRFEAVIRPKINGAWILDQLTRTDELDFMVLFSSVTALTGGPGQGDYTAANAYLDSFAAYRNQKGRRTITINWPAWKEVGMAVDYGVQNNAGVFYPISTTLAIRAFEEVINRKLSRVIIGELDLGTVAQYQTQFKFGLAAGLQRAVSTALSPAKEPGPAGPRVSLSKSIGREPVQLRITGRDPEEISEIERKIARSWSVTLGIDEVNLYDNFYQVGGDSILATRLLRELEQAFPGQVEISDIFTYLTISEMADYLERKLAPKAAGPAQGPVNPAPENVEVDFDLILEKLTRGEITPEEAERLTNRRE